MTIATATDYATHTRELEVEALNWMRAQISRLGLEPGTACINMRQTTGSNCERSPLPMPFDAEGREEYFHALDAIASFVFGGGNQCVRTALHVDEIKAEMDIPAGIAWDSLVGLVTLRNWAPHMMGDEKALMSAWAYFLSNPQAALFGEDDEESSTPVGANFSFQNPSTEPLGWSQDAEATARTATAMERTARLGLISAAKVTPSGRIGSIAAVQVRYGDGEYVKLFDFFDDQLTFAPEEFIGLDTDQAKALFTKKDLAHRHRSPHTRG